MIKFANKKNKLHKSQNIVGKIGQEIRKNVNKITKPRKQFMMPSRQEGIRIIIATDAWHPQINGVVRTLQTLGDYLESFGNKVLFITPDMFNCLALPTYHEIKFSLFPNTKITRLINNFKPDAIHIPTEGSIGHAVRKFCLRRGYPYTTSFHTRFPEYINARTKLPISWGYKFIRNFHKNSDAMMVSTNALKDELLQKKFINIKLWERGIDLEQFRPLEREYFPKAFKRPYWLYVGRVAIEKNIDAFLNCDLPGTKIIIGEGPLLSHFKQKYKENVFFAGSKFGDELTKAYSSADVFVFPSLTDTFGLVNVEALACGTPIAAFPVRGPMDILASAPSQCGTINENLRTACIQTLNNHDRKICAQFAKRFSWKSSTAQFIANLATTEFNEEFWLKSAKIPL